MTSIPASVEQMRKKELLDLRAEVLRMQTELLKLRSDRRDGFIKATLTGLCANTRFEPTADTPCLAHYSVSVADAVMEILEKEQHG